MLSAEAFPFIKIGGLGDYAGSLPLAIKNKINPSRFDIDIRIALPFHNEIDLANDKLRKCCNVAVPRKDGVAKGSVYETTHASIQYYFVKRKGNPSGYKSVYNTNPSDDARKYIFFSLASLQFLKEIGWQPHIIHANDWHTAAAVKQLKVLGQSDDFYTHIKSLLVVHNLPFLGEGSQSEIKAYEISKAQSRLLPDWAVTLPFPMGLEAADQIVAVSPSYANELLEEEFSDGLAPFFIAHQHKITGILNGIDTKSWNPSTDPLINNNYSVGQLDKRSANKIHLLKQLGFQSIDHPLLVLISRLTYQKGMDIILKSLPEMIGQHWTAIILGQGQVEYENAFRKLEQAFPDRLKYFSEYNNQLAHELYAAGDILLMPSLYEPCGLSQMIAMRYGCVPVARAVGGLKDSIISDDAHKKDGYLFSQPEPGAFIDCLSQAINDFNNKDKWTPIQSRGMQKDFSWRLSAQKYLDLYVRLMDYL